MAAQVLIGVTRIALGWYLAGAGWNKLQDEFDMGFGTFYASASYQRRSPAWLPGSISMAYGYALPWLETLVGGMLMLGLWTRVSAAAATVLFASIATALLGAGELLPRHHLMVFLPLAVYLAVHRPGALSADTLIRRMR